RCGRHRDAALRPARHRRGLAGGAGAADPEGTRARRPARLRLRPRLHLGVCVMAQGGVRRRIGIDVGGTNTDAVLLDGDRVVAAVKTPTTADVTSGVTRALADLLAAAPDAARVSAVMIGTTHFTNAVVQRRGLTRVAAVRIGLPASASLPRFVDWPDDLAELVRGDVVMLEGGHEYDGRPIVPFDAAGMRAAARRFRTEGVASVAVASVFSPLDPSCEEQAAAIPAQEWPEASGTVAQRLRPPRRVARGD